MGDVQNRLKSGGSGSNIEDQQRFLDTKNLLAAIHADVKGLHSKSKVSLLYLSI